jgi:hypothetical protein
MTGKIGTYSGDPCTSRKDLLRFLVGDTDCDNLLLADTEVECALTLNDDDCAVQSILFSQIAAVFSREANITVGAVSKNFSDVAKSYREQATTCLTLGASRAITSAVPFFGGRTKSGNEVLEANTDLIRPKFPLDLADNPTATQLNFEFASRED